MSSGLSSGELTRLHEIFATNERIEKAVLFGSRAMGLARSNSDVDIALVGNALTTRDVLHLASQLEESPLPYQFDLLLYHSIESEDLLRHVEQYGKTLYKNVNSSICIMDEWQTTTIGDLCSSISCTYKGNDKYVVLVNTSDVLEGKILNNTLSANKNLKCQFKKTFKYGDILYSEIRPANKRYAFIDFYDTDKYIASTKLMVLRAHTDIVSPRFLYTLLTSNTLLGEMQHLAETRSGTFPQITFSSELAPYSVKVPSIKTQKKIASILSAIDDKIELNNRINKNLEEQAQALFKSWFVDFEPFGGVMPEGWKTGGLLNIASYLNGLAMQKYRPAGHEKCIPVLKIKELRQGFCDDNSDLCSNSIKKDYIINDGDIIFSWSGTLLVDIWCGGMCGLNQHLFKVSSDKYAPWFVFLWTKYHLKKFSSIAADKATTMGHIKREDLERASVVIPRQKEYEEIGSICEPIYQKLILNKIENARLTALRDTLLPKLLRGDIDVSDVSLDPAEAQA